MHPQLFSGHFHDRFDLSTSEFLAEKELISIIPNFNAPLIRLLSQVVGPFEAGLAVDVPLWIALYLKQRQKCRLVPPQWLKVEFLENLKETESKGKKDRENEVDETRRQLFAEMPSPCWMEISQLLLQYACDDVPDGAVIKTLICDIADIRMAKLKNSMDLFVKSGGSYARVNNLTQFEICRVREFFTASLDHLRRLQEAAKTSEDADN